MSTGGVVNGGTLDAAIGEFITKTYNLTSHSETGQAPQARWETGGFLLRELAENRVFHHDRFLCRGDLL
jgi:hypothetical protein